MRRTSTGKHIELQPRDLEIFRLLQRYRYLRSTHLHAFVGDDRAKLIERLGKLYHDGGYLDRPEQQWEALGARCQPIIYSLTAKAAALLGERGEPVALPLASFGNGRQFLHALMVCQVLVEIELSAKERGIRFIAWDEIRAKAPRAGPVPQIAVSISRTFGGGRFEQSTVMLIPDAVFGLEYSIDGVRSYRFFALEADRGTMPIERSSLNQASYLKKLLCYRQILALGFHKTSWGVPNLFVLNALPCEQRLESVLKLIDDLSQHAGSSALLSKVAPTPTGSAPRGAVCWRRAGHPPLNIFDP